MVLDQYYWPDIDNPMCVIEYGPGALVQPADGLDEEEHARAVRTLALTGLDCRPGPAKLRTASDQRWQKRHEAWDKARRALDLVRREDKPHIREFVIERAVDDGYWAVWYSAFAPDADLRRRLVRALAGTCEACFDDTGEPVPRPSRSGALPPG